MGTATDEAIEVILHARLDETGPGVALAIVRDGELLHAKGYGMANLEWGEPIDRDTIFWIGSTTKPFTATAILLLEAEGKLRLDESIRQHLPELPQVYDSITIQHLLTHTSGVPNYVTRPGFWEQVAIRDHSPAQLLDLFIHLPLDFPPGTDYSYSNSGYTLLGNLIERLSGQSYAEFIRSHVFEPMGMRDSRYMSDDLVIPRRANGYPETPQGWSRVPHFSATVPYSAGALGSTHNDLIQWERALGGRHLLDAAIQERMQTPVRLANGQTRGYGLGWGLSTYRGRRVVHHAGGVPGFSAFFGRFVYDGVTVIVLSNRSLFDAGGLAAAVSNLVLELPERQADPVAVSDDALQRVAGSYRNIIGETLEVRPEAGGLAVSGTLTLRFLPAGETEFFAADSPDVTLRFEEPRDGVFTQATAISPFYWFVVRRRESKGE